MNGYGKSLLTSGAKLLLHGVLRYAWGVEVARAFFFEYKIIYENRLTFVKFCGILELPLGKIVEFSIDLYL